MLRVGIVSLCVTLGVVACGGEEVSQSSDTVSEAGVSDATDRLRVSDAGEASDADERGADAEEISDVAEAPEVSEAPDSVEVPEVAETPDSVEVADAGENSDAVESVDTVEVADADESSDVVEGVDTVEVADAAAPDEDSAAPAFALPPGISLTGPCAEGASDCAFAVADDAEVLLNLQRIYQGAALYYRTPHLDASGALLSNRFPAGQGATPIEGTCCSSNALGGPDIDGDDLCDRNLTYWATNTWWALAFNPHGEHYDKGCGTMHGPDTCDENQHAYVYAFESAGVLAEATMTASATVHVGCEACLEATVSVSAALDPEATWLETPQGQSCASGCLLLAPEHLAITLPTACDAGAVSGHVVLSESQRAGFLPPEESESLHPWWDDLSASMDTIVSGAVAAYQSSDASACVFPAAQGITPIEGTCCSTGMLGGPDADGDDLCDANPGGWGTATWSALGFAPDTPQGFVFETSASGEGLDAVFSVTAYADLDCDGTQSTFQRIVTAADAALGWETGSPEEAALEPGTCTPVGGDAAWTYPTRSIYYSAKQAE